MEVMMDRQRQRLQAVLRDRFHLKLRLETRELPVYELLPAKGGSKLQTPQPGNKGPSMQTNPATGELTGIGADMRMLTRVLAGLLSRPVIDRTGITEPFDLKLRWKPDSFTGSPAQTEAPASESDGASIFTALTEQLGLKLESKKGAVQVYVVENAEKPSEN